MRSGESKGIPFGVQMLPPRVHLQVEARSAPSGLCTGEEPRRRAAGGSAGSIAQALARTLLSSGGFGAREATQKRRGWVPPSR